MVSECPYIMSLSKSSLVTTTAKMSRILNICSTILMESSYWRFTASSNSTLFWYLGQWHRRCHRTCSIRTRQLAITTAYRDSTGKIWISMMFAIHFLLYVSELALFWDYRRGFLDHTRLSWVACPGIVGTAIDADFWLMLNAIYFHILLNIRSNPKYVVIYW